MPTTSLRVIEQTFSDGLLNKAFTINTIDTSSHADSLLFELLLDSASVFSVKKNGDVAITGELSVASGNQIELADGTVSAPSLSNVGDDNTGIYFPAADTIAITVGGAEVSRWAAGQLTLPDGAVGAPSLANAGDEDTGIYWAGDNSLAIATAGTLAVTVGASQNVTFSAAAYFPASQAVTTPSIAFNGDANTGLNHTGADAIDLVTAGTSAIAINSSQQATFSAAAYFPDGTVGAPSISNTGDTDTGIYFSADNTIAFATAGTLGLSINGSQLATFAGVVSIPDGSASAPALTNTGDTNCGIFFPADDVVAIAANGAEQWRINSSGQIGVGTTTPMQDIAGNASYDLTGRGMHVVGTNPLVVLDGSATSRIVMTDSAATSGERNFRIFRDGSYTRFQTLTDTGGVTGTDMFVINHTTNQVGVGRRDTQGTLHVSGNNSSPVTPSTLADDLVVSSSSETGITIGANDNKTSYIIFATATGGNNAFNVSYQHNTAVASVGPTVSGHSMRLRTGSDVRMLALIGQNVGLSTETFDASAVRTFAIENGTAPAAGTANQVYLYSRDVSASAELHCMDEAGNETQLSAHIPRHVLEGIGITPNPDDAMPLVEKHCNCVIGLQYITYRDPFTGVPQTKVIVLPDANVVDYQTQQEAIRDSVQEQINRWDAAKASRDESIAERQAEIQQWQAAKDQASVEGRPFTRPRPKDVPAYNDTPRPAPYTIKPMPQMITDGRVIRDRLKRTPNPNVIQRDQPL